MQHENDCGYLRRDAPFQYPRSDRRRCNGAHPPARPSTCNLSVSSVGSEAMQLRCMRKSVSAPATLSVSSVGSEAMQPPGGAAQQEPEPPFSILGRIGGDATRLPFLPRRRTDCLSVSSVGSEAMQRGKNAGSKAFVILSVSSVGSEAMQPPGGAAQQEPEPPFSILGRIGGDATQEERAGGRTAGDFQYPRSDRRRCNAESVCRVSLFSRSFSILGRIGGDATYSVFRFCPARSPTFSILGRIGGDATARQKSRFQQLL